MTRYWLGILYQYQIYDLENMVWDKLDPNCVTNSLIPHCADHTQLYLSWIQQDSGHCSFPGINLSKNYISKGRVQKKKKWKFPF